MTFYIDLIFLVSAVCCFCILGFTALFLKIKLKPLRFFLGSLLLALLSVKSFVLGINFFMLVLETILVLRFAFKKCSTGETIRRFCVFFGVCLLFGSVMNVMCDARGGIFLKEDTVYHITSKTGFFSGIIITAGILGILSFFINHRKVLYNVEITTDFGTIFTTAFFDSGNRLKEPASGRPVIILEREIIKEELHNTQEIFFKTVGSKRSAMTVFYISRLRLADENKEFYNLYAGISEHKLSSNGEFHALLNSELR